MILLFRSYSTLICSNRNQEFAGWGRGTYICGAIEAEIPSSGKAEIWAHWASREVIYRTSQDEKKHLV